LIRIFLCVLAIAGFSQASTAQLRVQPTGLFLNPDHPHGALQLQSEFSNDISVSLTAREKNPDAASASANCSAWVTIDPGNISLPPHSSTTVPVSVRIPAEAAHGEYVADIIVAARPEGDATPVETVVPLSVRIGAVYSDVKLANVGAERKDDYVIFRFTLSQLGNAPYRGNLKLRLENGKGREVHAETRTVDVYTKGIEELRLLSASIPKGRYRVFMNFDSDRKDLGDKVLLVLPKKYTIDINMP
jgi:hypothetical protein